MSMEEIEKLTSDYAGLRRVLAHAVEQMSDDMERVKRLHIGRIKHFVAKTAESRAKLQAVLEDHPDLFKKPKTRIFDGVRVGFMKQRGQVVISDEAATIERIRKLLPKEQAELLIRVRECVQKSAVYDLVAADLKRLGIEIAADSEVAVIKPVDSEVDKLVAALLGEAEQIEGDAT